MVSHVSSACSGSSMSSLPTASAVAFVDVETAFNEDRSRSMSRRNTYYLPRRWLPIPDFSTKSQESVPDMPPPSAPWMYTLGHRTFSKILNRLPKDLRFALTLAFCQTAPQTRLARWGLYVMEPQIFRGTSPSKLSPVEVGVLTGSSRPGVFSVFTRGRAFLVSDVTASLITNSQVLSAYVGRLVSLTAAAQQIAWVLEALCVSLPSGVYMTTRQGSTPNAGAATIFRYSKQVQVELKAGTFMLLGASEDSDVSGPSRRLLRVVRDKQLWLHFPDGTIGLKTEDRRLALFACRDVLASLLTMLAVGVEAASNAWILRSRVGINEGRNEYAGSSNERLNMYFPSRAVEKPAEGPAAAELDDSHFDSQLMTLIRAMTPCAQLAQTLAMAPHNPPHCIRDPHFSETCRYSAEGMYIHLPGCMSKHTHIHIYTYTYTYIHPSPHIRYV